MPTNLQGNLRHLSRGRGTAAEICRVMDINRLQYKRHLNGKTLPSPRTMRKICDYYGVTEAELAKPPGQSSELVRQRPEPGLPPPSRCRRETCRGSQPAHRLQPKRYRQTSAEQAAGVSAATVSMDASQPNSTSTQAIRDKDVVRDFIGGNAIMAFCDAPWVPVFVTVCFIMHTYLGLVALSGAIIIFSLALLNELTTRRLLAKGNRASIIASQNAQTSLRNCEVINALGMRTNIQQRWDKKHLEALGWQGKAGDRAGGIVAVQKFVRMGLQVAILGVGAYLSILGEITPGIMIAASIMMGRALAPVEQSIGGWKAFVAMREATKRLRTMFGTLPERTEPMDLPDPVGNLVIENVTAGPPGPWKPTIKGLTFSVDPGTVLAIVGPSAAGKSTLARVIVGVWPAASGHVRIDGSDIDHWDREKLGRFIGYVPQDIELFSGTIAENIARFAQIDEKKVIAAAQLAGVHEIIQGLPQGYDTEIGDGGQVLSGGQRQRVALARAVYGNPVLVVMDEPNAHLDTAGEEALTAAMNKMREAGMAVIVITHKPNLLTTADQIMILMEGQSQGIGPREQMLPQLMGRPKVVPASSAQHPQSAPASGNGHTDPDAQDPLTDRSSP